MPEKVKVTCPVCGKHTKARQKQGTIINHDMPHDDPKEPVEHCKGSGRKVLTG